MNPLIRAAALSLVVAGLAVAVYTSSFDNDFVWDDPIVLRQQMVAFKSIKDAFLPPENIPQFGVFYYRPLVVLTYMVDHWFSGPKPMDLDDGEINPFHVSVVIYHAIVTVFVFLLGRILLRRKSWGEWAAFAGAALFAVHPIHTESVCWMSGRSDIVASLGFIPAMFFFLYGRERNEYVWYVAAAVAFLLGLWAKETGLAVLPAIIVLELIPVGKEVRLAPGGSQPLAGAQPAAKRKKAKGRSVGRRTGSGGAPLTARPRREKHSILARYAPLLVALVVYFYMRLQDLGRGSKPKTALGSFVGTDLGTQRSNALDVLTDLIGAIGFYVRKVFVPTHLNAFIAEVPKDALTLLVGVGTLAAIGALGFVAWRTRERIGLALAVLFFATISPSFAILVYSISETPLAERYLYIPSVAICLGIPYAAGLAVEKVRSAGGAAAARAALGAVIVVGLGIGAAFGYSTSLRNEIWSDDMTFWKDAVAKDPKQGLPHLHLGLVYDRMESDDPAEKKRLMDEAEKEFLTALDEVNVIYDDEGRSIGWNNLANVYMAQGDFEKAENAFKNAIRIRSNYHTPHYGLGLLSYRRALAVQRAGDAAGAVKIMAESRSWLQKAVQFNPRYVKAHLLLGRVLFTLRDHGRSRQHFETVVRLQPGSNEAEEAQRMLQRLAQTSG